MRHTAIRRSVEMTRSLKQDLHMQGAFTGCPSPDTPNKPSQAAPSGAPSPDAPHPPQPPGVFHQAGGGIDPVATGINAKVDIIAQSLATFGVHLADLAVAVSNSAPRESRHALPLSAVRAEVNLQDLLTSCPIPDCVPSPSVDDVGANSESISQALSSPPRASAPARGTGSPACDPGTPSSSVTLGQGVGCSPGSTHHYPTQTIYEADPVQGPVDTSDLTTRAVPSLPGHHLPLATPPALMPSRPPSHHTIDDYVSLDPATEHITDQALDPLSLLDPSACSRHKTSRSDDEFMDGPIGPPTSPVHTLVAVPSLDVVVLSSVLETLAAAGSSDCSRDFETSKSHGAVGVSSDPRPSTTTSTATVTPADSPDVPHLSLIHI